jgi:hypothetical protein
VSALAAPEVAGLVDTILERAQPGQMVKAAVAVVLLVMELLALVAVVL